MPTASLSEQNRHVSAALPAEFVQPPRTLAPMPFWFLNDTLTERELLRQTAAFACRGMGRTVAGDVGRCKWDGDRRLPPGRAEG